MDELASLVFPDDRDDLTVRLKQMPRVGELFAFQLDSPFWAVAEVTWRLFKTDGGHFVAKPVIFLEQRTAAQVKPRGSCRAVFNHEGAGAVWCELEKGHVQERSTLHQGHLEYEVPGEDRLVTWDDANGRVLPLD